ncbi:MAG: hypothetical protein E7387_02700 [Ruminococcaceae bacterium]|nr:hypothetical protein [Oscillospiraceae bacterium]
MRTKRTIIKRTRKTPEEQKHVNPNRLFLSEPAPCLNPAFKDEKYIASRKIGDYYYSIHVKPAKPEVRDAMIFLNFAYNDRESLYQEVNGKAEERAYMSIATKRLLAYADENIGALKLFFTRISDKFPFTGIVMMPQMWREEFPIDLLMELIDSYDDEMLFTTLLVYLHERQMMNKDFVKRIIPNRALLVMYLDGAMYDNQIKTDLMELYDMSSLSAESKPSLKEILKKFILEFYSKYEEVFEYASKAINKEVARIEKTIRKEGELSGVTDTFVFRRAILRGGIEKNICIELLPFCRSNVEYFAGYHTVTICVGNGNSILPGSIADSGRIGEKLKLLTNDQLYKIMKSIFAKPTNLNTIAAELEVTPERAYKILAQLVEEKYVLKEENNQIYTANKEYFTKIIHVLENYGGEI